ncbi:hypothetical protein F4604DRAFT_1934772 [Suillus subluteus]|nr:hypothetical protein F4604DRAFT_1934772 [Suillus subluteus]
MTCGTLGIVSDLEKHACPSTPTSSSFCMPQALAETLKAYPGYGKQHSGTCYPRPRQNSRLFTIQWQADSSRTQRVIDHLHSNSVDCRALFFSDGKQSRVEGDRPSGKDKFAICAVIATHVFKNDCEYAQQYAEMPDKFCDSTNSHITSLKKRYWECYDKLHSTGAGVMPGDDAENLHAQVLQMFPWYDEFASIVGTNPALSLKTVSVHPGIDHAANFFAVAQAGRTSGSGSTQLVPPASHIAPLPPASCIAPSVSVPSSSSPSSSSPFGSSPFGSAPFGSAPFSSSPSSYSPSAERQYYSSGAGHQGTYPHPSTVPTHRPTPPPSESNRYRSDYAGGVYDNNDMDLDLRFDDVQQWQPPVVPNYWEQEAGATILNSPPKPRAIKRRVRQSSLSPSPSPSPSPPPKSFVLPPKSDTSHHNSRAAFDRRVSATRRPSAGSPRPSSSGSSWSKTASMSSVPASTSQTSQLPPSKGKGRQTEKPRSDLQDGLDRLNDEMESIQSDQIVREELKNERHMAKYNFARQVNEHKFLREERVNIDKEAAAAHQCSQEAKDSEIHLHEAEAKIHVALANVHAEEAATLRLKIELCRLMSGSSS